MGDGQIGQHMDLALEFPAMLLSWLLDFFNRLDHFLIPIYATSDFCGTGGLHEPVMCTCGLAMQSPQCNNGSTIPFTVGGRLLIGQEVFSSLGGRTGLSFKSFKRVEIVPAWIGYRK